MRGTDLATLRYMLLAEIGDYADPSDVRKMELNILLSDMQKWLGSEWDWPFLQHNWDATVGPSVQYVNIPTITADTGANDVINWERPVKVEVYYNQLYQPVDYGIGSEEYNALDFVNKKDTNDPIMRYRLVNNTSEDVNPDMVEVWPVPTTAQVLRFVGQRALQQMVADTDKADLDDMLLVYFAAAEKLARMKQADAQIKLNKAQSRLVRVRSVYPVRTQKVVLGQPSPGRVERQQLRLVAVAHS